MIEIFEGYRQQQIEHLRKQESRRAIPANQNEEDSKTMSQDNALKKVSPEIDGFEGYEDGVEGADQSQSDSIIRGSLVKFTNEAEWALRDGEAMPAVELVAVDIIRLTQRWKDGRPMERRILEAGEKFPDVEAMNDAIPKSEWNEGPDGKPQGPWQNEYILYLLNLETMDRYSFPTNTVGGGIAVRDLRDKTMWVRKIRGAHLYPVVALSDTFMKTRWGGRQRPHFEIKSWINLGGDDKTLPAPKQSGPTLIEHVEKELAEAMKPVEAAAKKPAKVTKISARKVDEPTLEEILNDDLPDNLK